MTQDEIIEMARNVGYPLAEYEGKPYVPPMLAILLQTATASEREAWKNAAIRLGEELSSVGPDGYYNMTAEQWLDWAMNQQPRGKNSLSPPQRTEQEPLFKKIIDQHPGLAEELKALDEQEPICPDCKAKVLYECVACSSNNYPPKENA